MTATSVNANTMVFNSLAQAKDVYTSKYAMHYPSFDEWLQAGIQSGVIDATSAAKTEIVQSIRLV